MRESLRRAVEHGVLVADQATGSFRFRHALLAEAIYATILPGEREELHARLADELARSAAAAPAELAPHWAAAGRSRRGAGRVGRGGTRGGGRLRPGGGARAPRAGARAVAGRAGRGRARGARPRRALLLGGRARQRKRVPRRARSSSRGERSSSSATSDPLRAALLHEQPRPLPARERPRRRRPRRVRARGRARAGAAALAGARAGAGGARARADAGLALRRVAGDLRAGARARPRGRRAPGRAPGAHGARQPTSPTSAAATRASRSSGRPCSSPRRRADPLAPAASLRLAHRRADDAGTAAGVGAAGGGGARGHAPLRARQHRARRQPDRGAARDRRVGRGRRRQRRRAPRHHRQLPAHAPHHPRRPRDRPRRLRRRAGAPRRRAPPRCARTAALGDLRRATSPSSPCGSAAGRTPTRPCATAWHAARPRGRPDPRLALRQGTARAGGAGGARTRPPRRRRRSRPRSRRARTLLAAARRAAAEAAAVTPNAAGWRALAEAEYERARGVARPELWSERRGHVGAARAPAARGLLPLAPGRGARRRRRAARRGDRAAPRRRTPSPLGIGAQPLLRELELLAERARLDPTPPDAAPSRHETGPGGAPRADAARGGGADARRPRPHQPRDRRRARDQRQDRQRPRLAHPAQARRAEPARGGRDRPPPRPAATAPLAHRESPATCRADVGPVLGPIAEEPKYQPPRRGTAVLASLRQSGAVRSEQAVLKSTLRGHCLGRLRGPANLAVLAGLCGDEPETVRHCCRGRVGRVNVCLERPDSGCAQPSDDDARGLCGIAEHPAIESRRPRPVRRADLTRWSAVSPGPSRSLFAWPAGGTPS